MPFSRPILSLALLWIVGAALRIPILAIPPIIPFIQADLRMSGTAVGALTGVPMIILAAAALPGSALVGRVGALRAILVGLLVATIGGALRALSTMSEILFVTTAVTSVGIAVAQPALSAIVREWIPSRIGLGTAIYSNGLMAGCIFPSFMTLPILMPALSGDWRLSLLAWSLPVLAAFLLLLFLAPKNNEGSKHFAPSATSREFDFGLVWRIGLIFGANNCVYFGTNAFLPPYLVATGHAHLVTEGLTAYNSTQVLGSLVVLMFVRQMERRHWPYIVAGLGLVFGLAWIATSSGQWTICAAAVLGIFSGVTLTAGLMLPPLLSKASEVARVAGAMFTVSYAFAMIGSVSCGAVWDHFGHPRFALFLLIVFALPLIVVTPLLDFNKGREYSPR